MKEFNDGGPAFPGTEDNYKFEGSAGMSLRDYFAAKALQGFMANKERPQFFQPEDDAAYVYQLADAMLKVRSPAEPTCCTPTADELKLLAEGSYTPEELWGGSRPTCPKCFGK